MTVHRTREDIAARHPDVPRLAWSVAELAAALGVSTDTVHRRCDAGELAWFWFGKEKRIPNSELERLFAEAAGRRSVAS